MTEGHEMLTWYAKGRHIYAVLGEQAQEGDPYMGTMESDHLANFVVATHNRTVLPHEPGYVAPRHQSKAVIPPRKVNAKEVWCPLVRRWMSPEEHDTAITVNHLPAGHRYQY